MDDRLKSAGPSALSSQTSAADSGSVTDTLPTATMSISAVERETGLGKDTLRVWERRYGFPQPLRDSMGERGYPADQVRRLRVIRRLMDKGLRPGKIVGLPLNELLALVEEIPSSDQTIAGFKQPDELLALLELIGTHRIDELRQSLLQMQIRLGIQNFIVHIIAPLNGLVGAYWASGRFAVFEEHLYTEAVQNVLRSALAQIQQPTRALQRPRILLTTLPQETHALGLLMAEVLLTLEGARCLSLGVQTPVAEIAAAARMHGSDVIGLSCSAAMMAGKVQESLQDLLAVLPPHIEVWAGGGNAALKRSQPSSIRVVDLANVGDVLRAWRAAHPQPSE